MGYEMTFKYPCKGCMEQKLDQGTKEKRTFIKFCGLSGRACSEYDQNQVCVNRRQIIGKRG